MKAGGREPRLPAEIQAVFQEHRGFYGSPRFHQELRAAGRYVGRHRVARLMRGAELGARTRRPFRPSHKGIGGDSGAVENLLQQDLQPPAPNRCWAGDITDISTTAGCRYVAVWIDLFSRRVAGGKLDPRMDAALVIEALNRATDYHGLLRHHEIVSSMSVKGCCWDYAVVESFFSTLKLELGLDDEPKELFSPPQLQRDLAFWIEGSYNRRGRHSTLGYLSPIDDEQQSSLLVHSHLRAPETWPRNQGKPSSLSRDGGCRQGLRRQGFRD